MTTLSGEQWKRLEAALLAAFPNESDLKRLVRFSVSENLDAIAGGDDLTARVYALIEWADARGKLPDLLRAACEERPDNQALHALAGELGVATHQHSPDTTAPAPASPRIGVNLGGAHIGSVGTIVGGDYYAGDTPPEETER